MSVDPQIHESWKYYLMPAFRSDNFEKLKMFLLNEKQSGKIIFPRGSHIFNAFNLTPLDKVKVVILGQDPYHGEGQAHGLCFSVQKGIAIPPSLKNIYKELSGDVNFKIPNHGNLTEWTSQGVFLLNAILTVEAHKAGSHQKRGWEEFTDFVIQTISDKLSNVVFMLWGNFAKSKSYLIDPKKHLVLTAAHPSPFSAHSGFFGCKHFSKANEYLEKNKKQSINWQIS